MLHVAAALLFALSGSVQECGQVLRVATSFRGTVRAVEMLGERQLTVTPADFDPQYTVTIEIESVEGDHLEAGTTRHFAIHSPSRTFGTDIVGKTFDLQVVGRSCDGVFGGFESLRVDHAFVEEFQSSLDVGRTYRAAVRRDADGELRLVRGHIQVPYHHGAALEWTNAGAFPRLGIDGEETIEFTVVSHRIWRRGDHWQFSDLYSAKITSR
jgi:hypothetical protein